MGLTGLQEHKEQKVGGFPPPEDAMAVGGTAWGRRFRPRIGQLCLGVGPLPLTDTIFLILIIFLPLQRAEVKT